MATRIFNAVQFVAVASGATVALPHSINLDDRGIIPDFVMQDNSDFSIIAVDAANVTVTNTGPGAANCNVLCVSWHTILREFGAFATTALAVQPFIPSGGPAGAPRFRVRGVFVGVQTASPGDQMLCNPAGGAFPINLPAITAANEGQAIIVTNVNASTNAITITPAGADTINSVGTLPLVTGFGSYTLVPDFSTGNWSVV